MEVEASTWKPATQYYSCLVLLAKKGYFLNWEYNTYIYVVFFSPWSFKSLTSFRDLINKVTNIKILSVKVNGQRENLLLRISFLSMLLTS